MNRRTTETVVTLLLAVGIVLLGTVSFLLATSVGGPGEARAGEGSEERRAGESPKELVRGVAAERNHATVRELADEGPLVAWLEDEGIALEEAAAIQPAYSYGGGGWAGDRPWCLPPPPSPAAGDLTNGYVAASGASALLQGAALGLAFTASGRAEPSARRGVFALATGASGVGLGVHGVRTGGDMRTAGFVHLAVGAVTTAAGVHAFRNLLSDWAPGSEERAAGSGGPNRVQVAPLLPAGGGEPRSGLEVRVRY